MGRVAKFNVRRNLRRQPFGLGLAFAIPLTPWPVLVWIQSQGTYTWSKHSAEALNAVASQAMVACLATTTLGFVLVLACGRNAATRYAWTALAILNAIALWSYIIANAVAYA